MKRRIAALLLAALTILPLTGCTNWDEGTYTDNPLGELSQYYQTDTVEDIPALTAFALPYLGGESLDPVTCGDGIQLTLTTLLYEPLYRLSPQFETERLLAQSESYDPESFTYTIRLRGGIHFSDGTALTARDVAETLLRAQQSSRYAARLTDVTAIKAVGSDTVTIQLVRDRRDFTALLDIPIVKSGTEGDAFPIGTGPYTKADSADLLERNPHWWRSVTLPFDQITLLSYKSQEAAAYAFSSHDVHLLAYDMTGSKGDVASTSGSYTDADTTILQFLGFNHSRSLFRKAEMRLAISMAVERSSYVSAYLMGHGVETQFPVSPVSSLYPESLEQTYTADDCAAAMTELLMADGEWIYNMTLLVNSENSFRVAIAQEIAKALEQYDFKVTVQALPWDQYLTALAEGRYDMYYGECKLTADWDATALVGTGGSLNYSGYSDPDTDALLAAYLAAGDDDRAAAMERLCRRLQSEMPIIPLCFKRTSVLLPYDAVDHVTPTAADPFYHLENWIVHWGTEK